MNFQFKKLPLKDAYLIENFYVGDNRGGFTKTFEKNIFKQHEIDFNVSETFASFSAKNVIRGLHFQTNSPQAKLVSVLSGRVWDVIVDLRNDSETFGMWVGEELSCDNHKAFLVPRGFAHGFLALEDDVIMLYQCDGAYDQKSDTGIRYDDPELAITWPVNLAESIHSERDLSLMSFQEYKLVTNCEKD